MSKTVYQLIAEVAGELSQAGISKDRKNQTQGYQFRGIDDVYNALSPIMSKVGLVILPRVLGRELTERTSAKGGIIFSVTVEAEFDFVSSHDGSKHTVKTFGEAMDSADKATNKAMSAAYKYAAFQAFCIPTEGDNDADSTHHTVAAKKLDTKPPAPYPTKDFEANKLSWKGLVESGKKTSQNIIDLISTKGTLTDAQKDLIKSWEQVEEDVMQ